MNDVHKPEKTRDSTAGRRAKTAGEIIDAAERTISGKGLAALRARDLAEEVGCALGYIYKVFPDLDTVVLGVGLRTLALLDARFLSVANAPQPGFDDPRKAAVARLVSLALAYLDFAASHEKRWRALFDHRLPEGVPVPEEYTREKARLFTYIEEPLRTLRPDLSEAGRMLLARSMFSATHGMVMLGLEEKLVPIRPADLRLQISIVVRAVALGLGADELAAP